MKNINLLPSDLGPGKLVAKIAHFCKKATIFLLMIFFVAALGFTSFFVIMKVSINNITVKRDKLKESVTALSKTEQKLFLTKERMGKIKSVLALYSIESDLSKIGGLIGNGVGVDISKAVITDGNTTIDTAFSSSSTMSDFIGLLMDSDYREILLNKMSFNPSSGYSAGFELSNK